MRNRRCLPALWISSIAASALVGTTTPAHAGSFSEDGSFVFDPSGVFSEGFESFVQGPDASASFEIVDADDALEGHKVLRAAGSGYQGVPLQVTLPADQRVYVASIWFRGSGSGSVSVTYTDQTPGESAQLFPTGRVTSDDWFEVQSAPFEVDGPRGAKISLSLRGAFDADAVEIKEAPGKTFQGPRTCTGVADPICGLESLCVAGWCRNAASWVPPVPEGAEREALSQYLQNRLQFFYGPYDNRKQFLPAAVAQIKATGANNGRWRFWNGFVTAIHRLNDWHSITMGRASNQLRSRRPLNVCFFEGDGDLSHQQAPSHPTYADLLVSYTGSDHTWGLKQGDRLVAVDGKHPIEWMRSLIAYDWSYQSANDPNSFADFAQRVRGSIPVFAKNITVIKCDAASCGQPELIEVASIPEDPPGTHISGVACDHRPTYIVQGPPENHSVADAVYGGLMEGTLPEEKIYAMVWDYLLGQGANDTDIKAQVATWADARGLVLDHRTGYGGTIKGPEPIVAFARTPTLMLVDLWRGFYDDEGPKDLAEGLALFTQYQSQAWEPGSSNAKTDVPIAVLLTLDGSASDYFPFAMKSAPKVRIFGPHGTAGAFSSFMGLNYWGAIGYQVACEDTIAFDGRKLAGHGVEPDEIVWPKQSDLVAGKDTLAERALAWVRSELKP
ncbi:MAG: hypothetical protein HY898_22385 [Deltaproteobacteria bacterium]|nr:hypothetical protein [Deltaproteobacteria bacterium]